MYISIEQAVGIWEQLLLCESQSHPYGTDTAQIYAYEIMNCGPRYLDLLRQRDNVNYDHVVKGPQMKAAESLVSLCLMFLKNRDANNQIFIDGLEPHVWLDFTIKKGVFDYRCEVQVKT